MKNILILALFFYCQQVFAHKTSDSFLNIAVSEHQTTINLSVSVRDLEYAVGLDVNSDNSISWAEVIQKKQLIESYVLSRLTLYTIDNTFKRLCSINNDELLVDEKSGGNYLVFKLTTTCIVDEADKKYILDYQLLFDIDKNHRSLILIESKDQNVTLVASPDNHTFNLWNKSVSVITFFYDYVIEGVFHILIGIDHILFLLALLLPSVLIYKSRKWQHRESISSSFIAILKIVTAFTVAHSITLTLSILEIVELPTQLVEVVIAITVLLTCIHTIKPIFHQSLWKLAFIFGFIHGFGFANVLLDLGLEETQLALSLLGFNIGVEIGQLLIVCLFIVLA